MGTEEKLYKKIQQAAQNAAQKDFPGMENIWARVENKLETQTLQQEKHLWKKIAVAASIVLVGTLAFLLLQPKENIIVLENTITAIDTTKNEIPTPESANGFATTNPVIKKDAKEILQQQIVIQNNIVINDTINYSSRKEVTIHTPMMLEEVQAKTSFAPELRNDASNAAFLSNQGYAAKGKAYSITTVSAEDISQEPIKEMMNNDFVIIRGQISQESANGNEPLIVLNNHLVTKAILNDIDPNSIASVTVLKNQAAISLYGEKGKNGAIVLTTKNISKRELKKLYKTYKTKK
ncbi:hypothetical protein [Flavobacterium psychraquaticum]|uniref:hypothetical protein n=1 Tax=Flavobacterium psychraquaticum TaxID=3103958 RepID=UPI002ACEF6FF|nr:hypothetical protein [Flavobacterium sp. LB-N7T]